MHLCSCGFANPDDETRCAACGNALSQENAGDALLLEDMRSGQVVSVPAPGGILGRAGDFSPDLFSPRMSSVHAVVAVGEEGHWTIEHTGRNASAVERGGVWSDLRCGAPQPLFCGETLKLADMAGEDGSAPAQPASRRRLCGSSGPRRAAEPDACAPVDLRAVRARSRRAREPARRDLLGRLLRRPSGRCGGRPPPPPRALKLRPRGRSVPRRTGKARRPGEDHRGRGSRAGSGVLRGLL